VVHPIELLDSPRFGVLLHITKTSSLLAKRDLIILVPLGHVDC
jgi:hypothetical protein